jgi:formylglycine-generating enzyme required for sulfatase activity
MKAKKNNGIGKMFTVVALFGGRVYSTEPRSGRGSPLDATATKALAGVFAKQKLLPMLLAWTLIALGACGDDGAGTTPNPVAPVISVHPQGTTYYKNATNVAELTVTAEEPSDGGVLSYQWYMNTADSTEGGTALDGETEASFTPPADTIGVSFYYVIVTNTLNGKTANATSNTARVGIGEVKIGSGLTVQSKVYDGDTTATVTGTAVLSGVKEGDVVTVIAGTVAFADKNVGTNKAIIFSGWSLEGADAGNYMLSAQHESITGEITAKPVTITGLTVEDKIYDGLPSATVSGTAVVSGTVDGDTVTVTSGTAVFADKNIGIGKTVTFSGWSLTGTDAGNYSLSAQPNATANITLGVEMVQIDAGTFFMGSPETEADRQTNETQHSVTLTKGFYMGKYEVTQEQYDAVMGSNPSYFKTALTGEDGTPGKRPVEYVSWYNAIVFCNNLSVAEGLDPVYSISNSTDPDDWGAVPTTSSNATWDQAVMDKSKNGYRLPTEAEWEYVCRAGTATAWYTGNAEDGTPHLNTAAWYSNNAGSKTHQVGLKTANAWGLYDMHGNVFEWCWDWYKEDITADNTDPTGAVTGTNRVRRGGDWDYDAQHLRSAYRGAYNPYFRSSIIGFRLVRS